MKNILSIAFFLVAFAANGQVQEYVIEASDSLITRGVLQIDADKFKATTQVSSDDTTLVSLDYLTGLLDNAEYADSLAFHSGTGYFVYYRQGVALDSTSLDGRYQTILTNPVTGTGTTNYLSKWTGLGTLGNSLIYDNGTNLGIGTIIPRKSSFFSRALTIEASGVVGNELVGNVSTTNGLLSAISFINNANSITTFQKRVGQISVVNDGSPDNGKFIISVFQGGIYREPLIIKSSGLVGLNTLLPTEQLDVNGNARFRSIGTTTTSTVLGVTADGTLTTNVSITGGATWKGGWNASTNTPTLSDATGTNGWWYKVTVAGTQNLGSGSVSYSVGDDVIHNGTIWQKFSAMISEADPVFVASDVYNWTTADSINWTTAYNWGNHADEGYLTSEVDGSTTNEIQDLSGSGSTLSGYTLSLSSDATTVTLPNESDPIVKAINGIVKSNGSTISAAVAGTDYLAPHSITNNYVLKSNGIGGFSSGLIYDNGTALGINTISPGIINTVNYGQSLHVYGSSTFGRLIIDGNSYSQIILNSRSSSLNEKIKYISNNNGELYFGYSTDNASSSPIQARISANGYLAIGSQVPEQALDVNGNARFRLIGTGTLSSLLGVTSDGTLTTSVSGLTGNWNTAYNDKINSAAFSGTTTKTLTLTQQDGGTVTANFTDLVDDADANVTNEGSLTVGAGTATTSVINSNTSGSTPVTLSVDGTNLEISEVGNTISLSNLKPDQTVSLTGSGATSVSGTYPNFTISSTDNNTTYTGSAGVQLVGNDFRMNIGSLNAGAISASTHYIPWYQTTGAHWRTSLAELQAVAGYNAGKLQNVTVSSTAPTTDYVLKYNGSQWAPAPDATGSSYWTQSSGALYPATIGDEVRIGSVTDLGAHKLQVDASSVFRLRNVNTSQPIDLITTGTGTQPYFRFEHDGSGGLAIAGYDGSASWSQLMLFPSTSRTPQFPAGLILGTSFSTSTAGSIRWNGTNFQGYNGSTWVNLDTQGGTGGMTDPMTTRGDIIYRNSSNVTARLGRGTAGQLLYSNGTDLSWHTPVKADIGLGSVENTALSTWTGSTNLSTVGSITQGNWNADPISVTKGGTSKTSYTAYALLAGGTTSTGTLQQVSGVGTAGQVLTSNGVGALPSWQAAPSGGGMTDPMTTAGDMIYRNGSNVTARLPKGTEGQILSISSGLPSWINNSSGGWVDNGTNITLATSTDNVLIGTTTDSGFKLRVEGNSYYTGSVQVNGSLIALKELRLSEYDVVGLGLNFDRPALFISPTDEGIKVKTTASGREIYNITPSVRANALNASSMRYYDGNHITDTLTVNTIYYITHIPQGGEGEILVKQDGTGGRTLTLYFYPYGQTGEPDSSTELTKVTVGATTGIKTTANKHTLIRYRRWGTKVTLEYLQEP